MLVGAHPRRSPMGKCRSPGQMPMWRGRDPREMPGHLGWNGANDRLQTSVFSFRYLAESFESQKHALRKEVHTPRCAPVIADETHWSEDTPGLLPKNLARCALTLRSSEGVLA